MTKPLKNVEVTETHVATLECEVSHLNVPSTWLKNGVGIEMSEKYRIVVQGKLHQLKIMNTSNEDSAEYTFLCGNDSVSATVTVKREYPLRMCCALCKFGFFCKHFTGTFCEASLKARNFKSDMTSGFFFSHHDNNGDEGCECSGEGHCDI